MILPHSLAARLCDRQNKTRNYILLLVFCVPLFRFLCGFFFCSYCGVGTVPLRPGARRYPAFLFLFSFLCTNIIPLVPRRLQWTQTTLNSRSLFLSSQTSSAFRSYNAVQVPASHRERQYLDHLKRPSTLIRSFDSLEINGKRLLLRGFRWTKY